MISSFDFVVDRVVRGKLWPSLAVWSAEPYTQAWREFGHHWPFVVPLRLQEYCEQHGMPINAHSINDNFPNTAFYPIGLAFFNFDIDYFALIAPDVMSKLQQRLLRVLFYYHEGDNPERIKAKLDQLCHQHNLDIDCYRFVSSNTSADQLPGFTYFGDSELWYWQRNRDINALPMHANPRHKEFTVLSRLHKPWRATVMTELFQADVLNNSYWSYGAGPYDMPDSENPIEVDEIPELRNNIRRFLIGAPYTCDNLSSDQHNDHSLIVPEHFNDAYCNIVLETHFDADQSGGTLVSEKTFKPIKHGQFFVVAGPPGTLAELRACGYRTFDSVIDNSYDEETNNTQRWLKLKQTIKTLQHNLPDVFQQCYDDISYNQQLFAQSKISRLNNLHRKLYETC